MTSEIDQQIKGVQSMGSVRNSQESRPGEINLFDTPYNVTDISE